MKGDCRNFPTGAYAYPTETAEKCQLSSQFLFNGPKWQLDLLLELTAC